MPGSRPEDAGDLAHFSRARTPQQARHQKRAPDERREQEARGRETEPEEEVRPVEVAERPQRHGRQKQTAEGLKALRMAAQLAPESARFAYVYAVALNDAGQAKEAMQVLAVALKRDPYDRDILSGLAYFTAQAGNREVALGYVRQLRELDPENSQYAQMAKQIEGAPPR